MVTDQMLRRLAVVVGLALFAPGLAAAQDEIIASGSFEGRSDHETTGTVTVKQTADGVVVVLEDDFHLDGAPDPKLGFGRDGYDPATQFSELESNDGRQEYTVPAEIDPRQYNEFWVWCERFSVPLGVASLSN